MTDKAPEGYRPCVGLALFNAEGLVFIGRRADKTKREEADFRAMAAQLSLDVEKFIADWSLGDAIAPDDAWRPWGRRTRLKRDIARLTQPPPEPPERLKP